MTEQLNLWKAALQVAFDQTCSVGRPKDWKLIKDALDSVNAALTQPAQPAEGGEAIVLSADVREYLQEGIDNATQCEEADVDYAFAEGLAQLLGPLYTAPPASQEQAQQPSGHIKEPYSVAEIKAKIASGDYSAEMLLQHAMLHLAQQPSGGEVKAAPVESYQAQDQAFHAFWYSHMLDDLMQPPLAGISHSTARYIWDSALAPKPEPMPEAVRVWANSPELVEDGNQWQQGYEHARAWVHAQLSVTKEQA